MQETGIDEGGDDAKPGGDEAEDLTTAALSAKVAPPEGKAHNVMVTIHRVEDLPVNGGSKCNPFVVVSFNGNQVNSDAGQQVTEHTYNQTCQLPAVTPLYEGACARYSVRTSSITLPLVVRFRVVCVPDSVSASCRADFAEDFMFFQTRF